MAVVVVGKGGGGKTPPPQRAMTVAEFVYMISIFCIILPKFVIVMSIIL